VHLKEMNSDILIPTLAYIMYQSRCHGREKMGRKGTDGI
jgi:hypothetical protein